MIEAGTVTSAAACSAQIEILEKEFAKAEKTFTTLEDNYPEDDSSDKVSERETSYREG